MARFFLKAGLALSAVLFPAAWLTFAQQPAPAVRWSRLGPGGGNAVSLAEARDGTLYIGTPDGHIFASADQAGHWELRGRAGGRLDGVGQKLLPDRSDARRLYAAIWYRKSGAGGGVFLSEDGGRHWTLAGLGGEAVRALDQSTSSPQVLVAGSLSGVFRSADSGKTWQRISPADDPELRNIDSLAIDPSNENIVYAGTYHLPWKTEDGGKTWRVISAGMIDDSDVMSMAIDPLDPRHIVASACSGIYSTQNGGAQWIKLLGIPYASRRTQQILRDSRDPAALYAATTEGLWFTADAGADWKRITPPGWVINGVALLPPAAGRPPRLLLATEALGLMLQADGGNFEPANLGFSHFVVAGLVADPTDPAHQLAHTGGAEEKLIETRDGGESWSPLPGGAPPRRIRELFGTTAGWWAALEGGGLARYVDLRRSWREIAFDLPRSRGGKSASRRNQPPPVVSRVVVLGGMVYAATDRGLWIGAFAGGTLHPLAPRAISGSVRDVSEGSALWAVTPAGLFRSGDAGRTWEGIVPPQSAGELLWLRHARGGGQEFLLLGTEHGVYRALAAAPYSWLLLQSGLPSVPASPVVTSASGWLIAASTGGVYLSTDQGNSWSRLDGPAEAGWFSGIVASSASGFTLGSESEGLLSLGLR